MGEIVHASQCGTIWGMDAVSAELSRTKSKNLKWSLSHWSCWQRHPTNKIMEKYRDIYLWLLKLLPSDCWKIINFIHPQFIVLLQQKNRNLPIWSWELKTTRKIRSSKVGSETWKIRSSKERRTKSEITEIVVEKYVFKIPKIQNFRNTRNQ